MHWVLIVTALVNGQPFHTEPTPFPTKEACLQALHQAEQHPLYKQYNAKASCEKQ